MNEFSIQANINMKLEDIPVQSKIDSFFSFFKCMYNYCIQLTS